MRKDAGDESLNDADLKWHDDHRIGTYAKIANTGFHAVIDDPPGRNRFVERSPSALTRETVLGFGINRGHGVFGVRVSMRRFARGHEFGPRAPRSLPSAGSNLTRTSPFQSFSWKTGAGGPRNAFRWENDLLRWRRRRDPSDGRALGLSPIWIRTGPEPPSSELYLVFFMDYVKANTYS